MLTTSSVFDSPEIVVEYIKQIKRIQPNKYILVTESNNDTKIFNESFSEDNLLILSAKGKDTCLGVSELSKKGEISNCAALVDKDLDDILKKKYDYPVFTTEYYDLECYAIHSDNWKRLIQEYLDKTKLTKANISNFNEFKNKCLQVSFPVVSVLFANNKLKTGMDFKPYKFDKKSGINRKFENSVELVITRLKAVKENKSKDWSKEKQLLKEAKDVNKQIKKADYKYYVSSLILCKCFTGIANTLRLKKNDDDKLKDLDGPAFKKIFRSFVSPELFKTTNLYKEITTWINAA